MPLSTEELTATTPRCDCSSPRSASPSPGAGPSSGSDDIPALADGESWLKIEEEFRAWSFHVYYRRVYRREYDVELRFLKALQASCRPIRDKQAVLVWYRTRKDKPELDDDEET